MAAENHRKKEQQRVDAELESTLRQLGRDFAGRALCPNWDVLDAPNPGLLQEIVAEAAQAGVPGFTVPEDCGGTGLSAVAYTCFIEEVSRACGGAGALFASHFMGIAPLLLADGEREAPWLARITDAERRGEAALFAAAIKDDKSPDFGVDRLATVITYVNGGCRLDGFKPNVWGAGAAAYLTVLARDAETGQARWVVAPAGAAGVEIQDEAPRLGMRLCPVNNVRFHQVELPGESLCSAMPDSSALLDLYGAVDPVLASVFIGLAEEARNLAMAYARERYQGGKNICNHDAVRLMLGRMSASIRAARAMAHAPDAELLASTTAAAMAEQTCLDAIQIHGGYGYMTDFRVERILRDAKTYAAMAVPHTRALEFMQREISGKT